MFGQSFPSRRRRFQRLILGAALMTTALLFVSWPAPPASARGNPVLVPGAALYFPSTGQTVAGPFLAYWLVHRNIGHPVSGQAQGDGTLTQWFEYARLELSGVAPEQATAADVHPVELGRLFADHLGYTRQQDAFVPKPSGPERYFPDTGHSIQNGFRLTYEQPGTPELLGPPISDEFASLGTTYQIFQFGALSWSPADGTHLVQIGALDAFLNGRLDPPHPAPPGAVNGETKELIKLAGWLSGTRWIEVDLSDHAVTAWVDDLPLLREKVVNGSPDSPTVRGTFQIYQMNRTQDISGIGWDGTPYAEKGVEWAMYFWDDYGFHGTTWRTSFGYSDSQGCIVMPNDLAKLLWEFAYFGTTIWIHD